MYYVQESRSKKILVIKNDIYEAGTNNIIIKLYCLLERAILFFILLYSMFAL